MTNDENPDADREKAEFRHHAEPEIKRVKLLKARASSRDPKQIKSINEDREFLRKIRLLQLKDKDK